MEQFRPACKEAKGGQWASRDNKARIQTEVFGVAAETRGGGKKKRSTIEIPLVCVTNKQENKTHHSSAIRHEFQKLDFRGKVLKRRSEEGKTPETRVTSPHRGAESGPQSSFGTPVGLLAELSQSPAAHQSSSYLTGLFFSELVSCFVKRGLMLRDTDNEPWLPLILV